MAANHHPRYDELLPAYALGALDADELRDLESHLATGCAVCEAELLRLAGDLELLGLLAGQADAQPEALAPAAAPAAADLRQKVLAGIAAEPRPLPFPGGRRLAGAGSSTATGTPRQARPPRWLLAAAAAIFALAVVSAIWGVARQASLGSEIALLRTERDELSARASALQHRVAEVQQESERLARSISVVTAPGVQMVSLSGMNNAQKATGRTYVSDTNHQAVFYAANLPPIAADKSYELWVVDNDEHKIAVGILQVNARGEGTVVVDRLIPAENIGGWVVTVEPRGGLPQPTGPIALAG